MIRPPAPWTIIDVDLARPLEDLRLPDGVRGALVIFRHDGAVLGEALLLPENTPLSPREVAIVAANETRRTVEALVQLGLDAAPAQTPQSGPWPVLEPSTSGPSLLDRAAELIARRRARPTDVSGSVVICTRKRPADLAGCLDSIAAEIAAGREVVVVDNGPDPETEAVVRARPGVRYVVEPVAGLSRARNAGVRAATGDVAVFVDDDVRPEPGWIEPLLRRFDAPDVAVVCGLVLPAALETEAEIGFQYDLGFGGMGLLPLVFDERFVAGWPRGVPVWNVGAGANMAVRRRTVLDLGGFDERVGPGAAGGCGDDSEYWHRALFAGHRIGYEPLSVVRHQHRRDWASLERQAYGYGFGHVVALFAQYGRDRDRGDLVRAFYVMPLWYLRRALRAPRRWLRGDPDWLLWPTIRGHLAGLRYLGLARGRRT